MSTSESKRAIEALVMVAEEPIEPQMLAQLLELAPTRVEELCTELAAEYAADGRGYELVRVAGGYRYQSHPDQSVYIERFVLEGQSSRLSAAALETLAIVAYKQPVSRAQIAAIRGVSVDGVIRTLQQRGFIEETGRDPGPGQASLYGTTRSFLERLGLDSIADLPALGQFVPGPEVVEALETGLRPESDDLGGAADQNGAGEDAPALPAAPATEPADDLAPPFSDDVPPVAAGDSSADTATGPDPAGQTELGGQPDDARQPDLAGQTGTDTEPGAAGADDSDVSTAGDTSSAGEDGAPPAGDMDLRETVDAISADAVLTLPDAGPASAADHDGDGEAPATASDAGRAGDSPEPSLRSGLVAPARVASTLSVSVRLRSDDGPPGTSSDPAADTSAPPEPPGLEPTRDPAIGAPTLGEPPGPPGADQPGKARPSGHDRPGGGDERPGEVGAGEPAAATPPASDHRSPGGDGGSGPGSVTYGG